MLDLFNVSILLVATTLTIYLAFSKKLSRSENWLATITPLSSIMGSGFLVCAPLLAHVVGVYSVFYMAALLMMAYAVGSAIRFNIAHFEPLEGKPGLAQEIALVSRFILAGAYFISITYYLQLLSAFALNAFHIKNHLASNFLTTTLLVIIGISGTWRGFSGIEKLEKYIVSLNLGMIAALLWALGYHNTYLAVRGQWALPDMDSNLSFHDLRVVLGLLIVVQGFETSRYLGDSFSRELRIKTMSRAQLLSSIIYLTFIALATVLFQNQVSADVTGILKMMAPIALVLPILLSVAAIFSQFNASLADTESAAGLIGDLSHNEIPLRFNYAIITLICIVLTWTANVNQIIAHASRAFALFYALQCLVAFAVAKKDPKHSRGTTLKFAALALLCFVVFILGIPSG
ncbi:MAG: hypothetical protein KDD33_01895 [Bdellovibrionales bacterium]|nr:hypothetical protein [Bdellovibrionales bacterium]